MDSCPWAPILIARESLTVLIEGGRIDPNEFSEASGVSSGIIKASGLLEEKKKPSPANPKKPPSFKAQIKDNAANLGRNLDLKLASTVGRAYTAPREWVVAHIVRVKAWNESFKSWYHKKYDTESLRRD